jgi:rhamnulokinase
LSSGTWSLLGAEIDSPIINSDCKEFNFSNYGGVCNTWLIWKNIQALWLLQECMRTWELSGQVLSHGDIIFLASQADAFGPIIDTDDLTFFEPGDFPSRIAEFCKRTGQSVPEDQGAISRCILESLALKYRFVFERLEKIMGKKLDRIHTIGGGSRNKLLNQFTAEATGLNVIAGPAEATAIGNIMMQLIAMQELDDLASSRAVLETSFDQAVFQAKKSDAWEEAYDRYQEIIMKSTTYYH